MHRFPGLSLSLTDILVSSYPLLDPALSLNPYPFYWHFSTLAQSHNIAEGNGVGQWSKWGALQELPLFSILIMWRKWLLLLAQSQHLGEKQVVKTVPGQDWANESKQSIYLFYKNLIELEEFIPQLGTKITVTGKEESLTPTSLPVTSQRLMSWQARVRCSGTFSKSLESTHTEAWKNTNTSVWNSYHGN